MFALAKASAAVDAAASVPLPLLSSPKFLLLALLVVFATESEGVETAVAAAAVVAAGATTAPLLTVTLVVQEGVEEDLAGMKTDQF